MNAVRCQNLQQVFELQSVSRDTGPQLFFYLFVDVLIIWRWKSAEKLTMIF